MQSTKDDQPDRALQKNIRLYECASFSFLGSSRSVGVEVSRYRVTQAFERALTGTIGSASLGYCAMVPTHSSLIRFLTWHGLRGTQEA